MAPSLMSMPDEMLIEICKKFCHHCSAFPRKPRYRHHWRDYEAALLSVSLTCRRLRDIALPIRHHCVAEPNEPSLLRNLIARQNDSAARIRSLYLFKADWLNVSDEEVDLLQAEARRLKLKNREEWDETAVDDEMVCYYRFLVLALALVPNAEYLNLEMPANYDNRSEVLLKAPFAMKSVGHLSLHNHDWIDLGLVSGFLADLPCLQTLEVGGCGSISQHLPLAGLRRLIVKDSVINEKSLQRLVDSCPRLDHFEFYRTIPFPQVPYFDREPCTWGQVQRILRPRRKTLKHLNVASECWDSEPRGPDHYWDSFRDFEVLETLWVRVVGFGKAVEDAVYGTSMESMVDMLPESLVCLGLCGPLSDWAAMRELGLAVRQGRFPRLETVMVEAGEQMEYEWMKRVLAEVGVACRYLDEFNAHRIYNE